jgi:[ribosomal protein S18]-alanine N-acetyltransferase
VALSRDERTVPAVSQRGMREGDLPAVNQLERAAYLFPWSEAIFRDCLRVGYFCRVLEAGGSLAGYAIMSLGAGEAHVLNLCLRADLRGCGVGERFLTWLLHQARTAGQDWAFLEVRPSNRPAIRLYERLGFQPVGTRRGYYQAVGGREDAIVYRLDLSTWRGPPGGTEALREDR